MAKKKTFNWIDISRTGTILYRRAYGIDANTFWKLYRTIYKQLHCNQFSSSLLKEKWRKGACNSLMQSPTRLSFDIRYFMCGSTYFINNKTTITTITTNAVRWNNFVQFHFKIGHFSLYVLSSYKIMHAFTLCMVILTLLQTNDEDQDNNFDVEVYVWLFILLVMSWPKITCCMLDDDVRMSSSSRLLAANWFAYATCRWWQCWWCVMISIPCCWLQK